MQKTDLKPNGRVASLNKRTPTATVKPTSGLVSGKSVPIHAPKSSGRLASPKQRTPITKMKPMVSLASDSATVPERIELKPKYAISGIVAELRSLQRQRSVVIKSRIMQANRLQAIVAGTLGFSNGMAEKERLKKFVEATGVIDSVNAGTATHHLESIIKATSVGIKLFEELKMNFQRSMIKFSKQLPVHQWVCAPDQRGFGTLFLAIVVGEAGDLSNYANPGKLWKRFGCAPHVFDGQTKMGATWKGGREGKLPAEEWEKFGYSPRRRSIAYLIGEGIVKQNWIVGDIKAETDCDGADDLGDDMETGDEEGETDTQVAGPYRRRYDESKSKFFAAHPEYESKTRKGEPGLRCHRHGMLLATKLLLKNIWIEWNKA
jgi:hypothetical protein